MEEICRDEDEVQRDPRHESAELSGGRCSWPPTRRQQEGAVLLLNRIEVQVRRGPGTGDGIRQAAFEDGSTVSFGEVRERALLFSPKENVRPPTLDGVTAWVQ